MKKIIVAILATLTSVYANFYNLTPIHITKDISCVIGDFNPPTKENRGFVSNICYIDMGDNITLLDAGPTYNFAKELYTIIKKEYPNKKITNVILSNYHDDRVLGASYFKEQGATIIGAKSINEDIKNNPQKFERMKIILPKEVLENTKLINADKLVEDGYKIKGSKKTVTILKLSKTSEENSDIAIYSKDDNFIFTGNIVFNGRMLNYTKNSNVDGWIEALEKISKLNAKYVLGGHGKRYDKESYKPSLDYLKKLKKAVGKAHSEDIDITDIKVEKNLLEGIKYYDQLNKHNIRVLYDQLEWAD